MNDSRRRGLYIFTALIMIVVSAAFATSTILEAGSVSTANYSILATTTNNSTTNIDDIQAPIALSGGALINGDFMASDALNSHVHKTGGSTDVPAMPATNAIQIEGAVQQLGQVFTQFTTGAQNATLNDLPLLGVLPAVGDAWYSGCDNPCRIITTNIDTPGAGTWSITYEYWDGDSYESLTNVDDSSSGFTVSGERSVTWDMPSDWTASTVTGNAISSYWARSRVSAFTSITTQPLGSKQQYENGQWWTWIENLNSGVEEQLTLFHGGSTNLVAAHQTFPGADGITTGDDASMELGNAYSLAMEGRVDAGSSGLTSCVLCKTGAVTLSVSGSATNAAIWTSLVGGGTSDGHIGFVMPDTGEQIIIMASDGTDAATWVNSTGGMVTYSVQTITDNANNLTWANNGGIDYFDWIRIDTASATVFNMDNTQIKLGLGILDNTESFTDGLGLSAN